MRSGASEKMYIGLCSSAYGLLVLYTTSFELFECMRKNFRFWDASSQTNAITLKSATSSFWTASKTIGNNWWDVMLCVANWAKGNLRSMNNPLTINTSIYLATGNGKPGVSLSSSLHDCSNMKSSLLMSPMSTYPITWKPCLSYTRLSLIRTSSKHYMFLMVFKGI